MVRSIRKYKSLFLRTRETRIKYLALCVIALHFLSFQAIGYGYTLCLCEEGHVEVVSSLNDLCCKSSENDILTVKAENFFISGAPLCDNCIGLSISDLYHNNNLLRKINQHISHPLPSLPAPYNHVSPSADVLPQNAYYNSVPHLNISLLSFSTVSLLI